MCYAGGCGSVAAADECSFFAFHFRVDGASSANSNRHDLHYCDGRVEWDNNETAKAAERLHHSPNKSKHIHIYLCSMRVCDFSQRWWSSDEMHRTSWHYSRPITQITLYLVAFIGVCYDGHIADYYHTEDVYICLNRRTQTPCALDANNNKCDSCHEHCPPRQI